MTRQDEWGDDYRSIDLQCMPGLRRKKIVAVTCLLVSAFMWSASAVILINAWEVLAR